MNFIFSSSWTEPIIANHIDLYLCHFSYTQSARCDLTLYTHTRDSRFTPNEKQNRIQKLSTIESDFLHGLAELCSIPMIDDIEVDLISGRQFRLKLCQTHVKFHFNICRGTSKNDACSRAEKSPLLFAYACCMVWHKGAERASESNTEGDRYT